MAIIRCPECDHNVSDNAPVCPNCGISILNNIKICPDCGKVNLKEATTCSECGCLLSESSSATGNSAASRTGQGNNKKKSNRGLVITIVSVAIIAILAISGYAVISSQRTADEEETEYAALQGNTSVEEYEAFLKAYPESKHSQEVQSRLNQLKQISADWKNINLSCSKQDFLSFLSKYPSSPYENECKSKLDSLDWVDAVRANTTEAYEHYLSEHPEGIYTSEAMSKKNSATMTTVTPEDKKMVSDVFSSFFSALTAGDETSICTVISPVMDNFLNKNGATKSDVVAFMHKIHQNTNIAVSFSTNNDYKINKQTAQNGDCNYSVQFSVDQKTEHEDGSPNTIVSYTIVAKITSDYKITVLNMRKVSV